VSRYQKGKTNLDLLEQQTVSGSGISWAIMQVCTLLQTDNHASTPQLSFLQAGSPSCRPTNSVKALKAPTDGHCKQNCSQRDGLHLLDGGTAKINSKS